MSPSYQTASRTPFSRSKGENLPQRHDKRKSTVSILVPAEAARLPLRAPLGGRRCSGGPMVAAETVYNPAPAGLVDRVEQEDRPCRRDSQWMAGEAGEKTVRTKTGGR